MNPWVVIYKSAWGLLVVLLLLGMVFLFLPKCHNIRELQNRKAAMQEENRDLERMTKELRLKRERFQSDPAFVEETAREAGMVRRDETVFIVEDSPNP